MFLRSILRKLFSVRERKDVEMVKPFLEHLEDLRWMLVKMVATLGLGMMLSFGFRHQLITLAEAPFYAVNGNAERLRTLGVADSMTISLNLAFYAGIVLTFPFQLYYLAGFVLPALSQKEKAYMLPIVGSTFALFLGGVLFCFDYVLPLTLRWLRFDSTNMGFTPTWTADLYFSFTTQFVLIFGLSFELPVLVVLLVKLGLLTAATLRRTRAYGIIAILVLGCFIAPSPDPITMLIVSGPMMILFEGSIWVAALMERRERRGIPAAPRDLSDRD